MRRITVILALLACAVGTEAADAHFCAHRVRLSPNRPGGVTVGLASEEKPVVEFVLHLPESFELRTVAPPPPHWTAATEGRDVRFSGGPLRPLECMYVTVAGRVAERGVVVIPMTVKAEDGTTREYTSVKNGDQYAAQVVVVSDDPTATVPGEPSGDGGDEGGSRSPLVLGAVVVGVAAAGAAWWYRSRRAGVASE